MSTVSVDLSFLSHGALEGVGGGRIHISNKSQATEPKSSQCASSANRCTCPDSLCLLLQQTVDAEPEIRRLTFVIGSFMIVPRLGPAIESRSGARQRHVLPAYRPSQTWSGCFLPTRSYFRQFSMVS